MNFFDVVTNIKPSFTGTFDQTKVTGTQTLVGEVHAALVVLMNLQKNQLLQQDSAGKIFCHIVSPTAVTVIQSAAMSEFSDVTSPILQENGILMVNGVQLIINPYWDEDQSIRTVHMSIDGNMQVAELFLKNISFI